MTSFGWKRKVGAGVVRKASQAFEEEAKDEELDNEVTRGEVDWLTLAPKRRLVTLEDARAKCRRLSDEAAILAGAERFWEAIRKWDEALLLCPTDSCALEMKAQAQMSVGEVFPAVQTAQLAVTCDPRWWVAWQTLGRTQLNLGEVGLAIRSFSKAVFLNPADRELWQEDLLWACSVRDRSKTVKKNNNSQKTPTSSSSSSSSVVITNMSDPTRESDDDDDGDGLRTAVQIRSKASSSQGMDSDSEEGTGDRQTVLNLPPNYVHLRG